MSEKFAFLIIKAEFIFCNYFNLLKSERFTTYYYLSTSNY